MYQLLCFVKFKKQLLTMMPRILITGGTGFIGNHLLTRLQQRFQIYAFTRNIAATSNNDAVHWIEQDLTKPLDFKLLPESIDGVVHLAQSKDYRSFPEMAIEVFQINTYSTIQLLDYARKANAKTFILASTGGLYGYGELPFQEEEIIHPEEFHKMPLSHYFASKFAAELFVKSYQNLFSTIICRFFFVYGARQSGQLVANLIRKIQSGESISVAGNPGIMMNPICVFDAVRVIESALLSTESGIFNISGDEKVTVTDLVHLISKVTGKSSEIVYNSDITTGNVLGDNAKMKKILGVYPQISLLEGLRMMID